jgi:hypothetical protein
MPVHHLFAVVRTFGLRAPNGSLLMKDSLPLPAILPRSDDQSRGLVAVISMSGTFSLSETVGETWHTLASGVVDSGVFCLGVVAGLSDWPFGA